MIAAAATRLLLRNASDGSRWESSIPSKCSLFLLLLILAAPMVSSDRGFKQQQAVRGAQPFTTLIRGSLRPLRDRRAPVISCYAIEFITG